MTNALKYLGLARRAGALEIGEENCGVAVRSGKARLLIVASDASDNAKKRAEGYISGKKTPLCYVPFTKEELAEALGKGVCSMVSFMDTGLALGFVKNLNEQCENKFAAIEEDLQQLNERFEKRRNKGKPQQSSKSGYRRKIK